MDQLPAADRAEAIQDEVGEQQAALSTGKLLVQASSVDLDGEAAAYVRSDEEFSGERFWPSGATEGAGRAGHMPGAIHVPVDLARKEDGSLADGKELRRACEGLGIGPDRKIVTYCTIGNRASQVAFVLSQVLGYQDVAVYYGGWSEWGSTPDAPVET